MIFTFYTNGKKLTLSQTLMKPKYSYISIENTKNFIILRVDRKISLEAIGQDLIHDLISLKRYKRLKNLHGKTKILKFKKDKNKKVLIEKLMIFR